MFSSKHGIDLVARVAMLFTTRGTLTRGSGDGRVSPLEHALQCARLAELAHASDALVVAAFLHDVGHLLRDTVAVHYFGATVAAHEDVAAAWLAAEFGAAVAEPVRLHVQAKRFLVGADTDYLFGLPDGARHSLAQQGGPMSQEERARFRRLPHADDAVLLRHWDDSAQERGRATPPLAYYLTLLTQVHASQRDESSAAASALYIT